jgi:hypothetical protein
MTPVLKAREFMHSKLMYDEPLSTFAFNLDLRRYSKRWRRQGRCGARDEVERCRLTVSKPVLKASTVSTHEATA